VGTLFVVQIQIARKTENTEFKWVRLFLSMLTPCQADDEINTQTFLTAASITGNREKTLKKSFLSLENIAEGRCRFIDLLPRDVVALLI
jgi:hypothetical protein